MFKRKSPKFNQKGAPKTSSIEKVLNSELFEFHSKNKNIVSKHSKIQSNNICNSSVLNNDKLGFVLPKKIKYNSKLLQSMSDKTLNMSSFDCSHDIVTPLKTSFYKKEICFKIANSNSLKHTKRSTNPLKLTPLNESMRKTPRTAYRMTDTPKKKSSESLVIVALVEGRGLARGEIGMASLNLRDPILTLSQFSDSQTYVKTVTMLHILRPKEVLFPSTVCDNGNRAKVFNVVNENFESIIKTTVQRHYFNESKGLDLIEHLAIKENSSVVMNLRSKYYCLAACGALIKYIEHSQKLAYAPQSLKVVFKGSDQTTLIDVNTANLLELTTNLSNPKSNQSLFGILNHTSTVGGSRLLRSNILQPPNCLSTIQARLDCVEELSTNSDLFYGAKSALSRIKVDVDSLLSSIVQIPKLNSDKTRENNLNNCIILKHVVDLVPIILDSLKDATTELLQAYKASLHDIRFKTIQETISLVLRDEVEYQKGHLKMRVQRCYAVKEGKNCALDLSRIAYNDLIEDINELVKQLSEKYNLTLKLSFNSTRGFYVQTSVENADKLPEIFVNRFRNKKVISCTTPDLIKQNTKVEQTVRDINSIADVVISELLLKIRESIGCLYNFSEIVSTLDVLLAFAHARTTSTYTRPEFTQTLAIKNAKHPVLDKIVSNIVTNNVYSSEETKFCLLTGPNMSGKSTYLKTIAVLQVMAQIGSFVPAQYASFRIADQIFSRVGADDDIETNSSTFTTEMNEVNYIIQNISNNSLVVIDELGRGTSINEGIGLCWAISEHLLKYKAFVFFATHFLELSKLEYIFPSVKNYHFEIKNSISTAGSLKRIVYTYVLKPGHMDELQYGINLAKQFNFPTVITAKASIFVNRLKKTINNSNKSFSVKLEENKLNYSFASKLLQVARSSNLERSVLSNFLNQLKLNNFKK